MSNENEISIDDLSKEEIAEKIIDLERKAQRRKLGSNDGSGTKNKVNSDVINSILTIIGEGGN